MRLQLDGPDLEELLVRARHEYGSDVRIVKADKVRTGGVGGFFARELYELSIEIDEPDDAEPPAPKPAVQESKQPASLLDLADAISDREVDSARPRPARIVRADEEVSFTPGLPPKIQAGPALSTDGESFASILAGLTRSVADQPSAAPSAPSSPPVLSQPPVSLEPDDAGPLLVRDSRADTLAAERPVFADPIERAREQARKPRGVIAKPLSVRDLRDLGLPRELLPARGDSDLLSVLVGALRSLPRAPEPPKGAGEIFAVVGEGEGAWDAAAQVAKSLDLDERSLVYLTAGAAPTKIAPSRRITALEQLPARIDRWRKRSTPTIAVVDAPMNLKAASWNRQALTALCPEAVWLVVPATRKTDDVARWAGRLGHTDGIVVTDVDASSDPASVLHLGMPVAWLDGRPATPGAWAGLLVDRLVEAR